MKSVLITGASGFIGTHLSNYLLKKNIKVYAISFPYTAQSQSSNENYIESICNLDDILSITDTFPKNIDVLYHFAWDGVSTSNKNKDDVQIKNIQHGLNVMKFAKDLNIKKIIFAGSMSEYAYSKDLVDGYGTPSPSDLYSASKIATHYICDMYAKQYNQNFIWTLISSIYGPGREDNNLISYAIKSLLNNEYPKFSKLEQLWDYIYIDDLIKALYLIGTHGLGGSVYPIGSGEIQKLSSVVYKIRDSINSNLPLGIGEMPYKTQQLDNSIPNISLLKKDTGFIPCFDFDTGIRLTIEYFKNKL